METVIERVKKLLRMAQGKANAHESAVAASMAARLMEQHNIDTAQVQLDHLNADSLTEGDAAVYRAIPIWVNILTYRTARLFECSSRRQAKDGMDTIEFLGTHADVTAAQQTITFLTGEIQRLAQLFQQSEKRTRRDMNDFRIGASASVCKTIDAMISEREARQRDTAYAYNALVIAKQAAITAKYGTNKGSTKYSRGSSASDHGRAAGEGVRINPGVSGASAARLT